MCQPFLLETLLVLSTDDTAMVTQLVSELSSLGHAVSCLMFVVHFCHLISMWSPTKCLARASECVQQSFLNRRKSEGKVALNDRAACTACKHTSESLTVVKPKQDVRRYISGRQRYCQWANLGVP